ncbi:hypothetical protein [Mycobacterium persicum]|uniref:Uncharacterized protein n=1 Tax=Mycobacterium persicum TaxID=1487726 RepID=A0AB38UXZ0_9MYCO|nr:hypothetical protein [Mycobacterium persicum]ORB89295.1 hypothetical protein B1T49_08655 [Mycobacterium persicum]VAZ85580.1 hypothetical protein LAUMK42_04418 [Mycobacterium persicum]
MTTSTAPPILSDPAALTPAQWSARLAAFTSRGRGDDDPGVTACRAALSYWRVRRVLDSERGLLSPDHIPALADLLRHAHAVAR